MEIEIKNVPPLAVEFAELRSKVGWGETDLEMAAASLDNSLFHVTARFNSNLIGMSRVIGDGVMFFYIQDLIVDPDFQSNGLGNLLMEQVERYLSSVAFKGATIGLLSAQGKESFYARYGYSERTGSPLGLGMCKFV